VARSSPNPLLKPSSNPSPDHLPDRSPVTLGIDVGGTKMLGLALDPDGTVVGQAVRASSHPGPSAAGHPAAAHALVALMAELASELQVGLEAADLGPAISLGIGVPGLVDDTGRLRLAPNLPAGDDLDVARMVQHQLGMRVVADNDATCAAVAEWVLGAAVGRRHVLMVTLGTGIGGGLVCDGRVMRGTQGFAGEIGHMVVDPSGPRCTCGKRGCWERFASGSGLARLAREAAHAGRLGAVVHMAGDDPDSVRGEHVTAAAAGGDQEAQAVLDELGWWIAVGLSNLALVLDPEVIVMGGGMVHALPQFLGAVRAGFVEMLEGADRRPEIPIVAAVMGEQAGAVGAALVARDDDRYAAGLAHRRGAGL
jgi:glucokinase